MLFSILFFIASSFSAEFQWSGLIDFEETVFKTPDQVHVKISFLTPDTLTSNAPVVFFEEDDESTETRCFIERSYSGSSVKFSILQDKIMLGQGDFPVELNLTDIFYDLTKKECLNSSHKTWVGNRKFFVRPLDLPSTDRNFFKLNSGVKTRFRLFGVGLDGTAAVSSDYSLTPITEPSLPLQIAIPSGYGASGDYVSSWSLHNL